MFDTDGGYPDVKYVYEYRHHLVFFTNESVRTGMYYILDKKSLTSVFPDFYKVFKELSITEAQVQMSLGTMYRLDHYETSEGKKYSLHKIWVRK